MSQHRQLRLVCTRPKVDVTVNMGDGAATPTAGMAGYEVVDRLKRKGLTARSGVAPYQQDVPIFLDGWFEGRTVDRTLGQILSLGEEQAVFHAFGPIWRDGDRFVFGGEPEFSELLKDGAGRALRARLTLKLMEYEPVTPAGATVKHKVGPAVGQAVALSYVVAAGGETLARVAAKVYDGNWERWPEIGGKNGIRDPFRRLDAGRVLAL